MSGAVLLAIAMVLTGSVAQAAMWVRLPPSACSPPAPVTDVLFADSFGDPAPVVGDPSGGNGGTFPGAVTRSVYVPALFANQDTYLFLPAAYDPGRAWPLLLVLHGTVGAGNAPGAAQSLRTEWSSIANNGGFIVLAVAANGGSGSWVPASDTSLIGAALNDAEAAYNVDRAREYLWGFSAGGHFGHGIVLFNTARFAAYGVNAGALQGYAGTTAPAAANRVVPVNLRVGQFDTIVLPSIVQADRTRFVNAGWVSGDTVNYTEFASGHTYGSPDLNATWQFVCRFAVVP